MSLLRWNAAERTSWVALPACIWEGEKKAIDFDSRIDGLEGVSCAIVNLSIV